MHEIWDIFSLYFVIKKQYDCEKFLLGGRVKKKNEFSSLYRDIFFLCELNLQSLLTYRLSDIFVCIHIYLFK